jgi:hypothetical protein
MQLTRGLPLAKLAGQDTRLRQPALREGSGGALFMEVVMTLASRRSFLPARTGVLQSVPAAD